MSIIYKVALILVIVGAVNWGLSAVKPSEGGMNLVHRLLGTKTADKKLVPDTPAQWNKKEIVVYTIVAIAGVVVALMTLMKKH
jgi:uncharacterized membrane protein YuzA (DUF378 family)